MQTRAIVLVPVLLNAVMLSCAPGPETRRVRPSYDEFTRRLIAVYADQDGDARIDQWSYFDANRPLRGEKDVDGDGRVEQWEYFNRDAALDRVGSSSRNDGVEDTWTYPAAPGAEGRIDRSRNRDRHVDRREYFLGGVLQRAEEDTNADGRVDRWDHYEAGALRRVEFDTTFTAGRPNYRVSYDASGKSERVEAVSKLDGTLVPAAAAPPRR